MKKNELIKLLTDCGYNNNLASTQLHKYTIPRNGRNSFKTSSLDNRSNTPWGRGEYIIVPYEHDSTVETDTLLNNWKILAKQDKNQYLILGVDDDNWELYNYNGELLGGNKEIQVRFGKSNNQKIILREKKAATFYKKAMRHTIDFDPNLEKMQNSFMLSKSGNFLTIGDNNFNIGCNTHHIIRKNDIDESITWNHQEKDYYLYLEHTPESIKDDFVPEYNKCYKSVFNIYYDTSSKDFCLIKHQQNISENYNSYLAAIRTKPFLLLAGISGTGKSQIVKEMAFSTCPNIDNLRQSEVTPGNYCLVEVKPNWHDSSELLGYDSVIKGHYIVTKFVKFVAKAMSYPEVPFFVCLDEMNLAPVEQYFAEFLSVLESRKHVDGEIISEPLINKECFQKDVVAYELFDLPFPKTGNMQIKTANLSDLELGNNAPIWHRLKEEGLCIPQNLIVIGTVNMDETTHQFSRKVIDRAMTFEMNEADFNSYFEDKVTLDYVEETLDASLFISNHVSGNKAITEFKKLKEDFNTEDFKSKVVSFLSSLNEKLANTPFKIAYRVQNELVLYFAELMLKNLNADQDLMLKTAFDDIMMMKVLPRIEGDDDLLGTKEKGKLHDLFEFAKVNDLPKSVTKIDEMLGRLSGHFTSFWP